MEKTYKEKHAEYVSKKPSPDNQGLLVEEDNPKNVEEASAEVNRDWQKLQQTANKQSQ